MSHDLPDSVGQIALSATLTPRPTGKPDSQEYLANDSTRVQLWITPELSPGLMAATKLKVRQEPVCRLTIGGRFALVFPFQVTDATLHPVHYGAIAIAYPREGLAINILIESPTEAGRNALLGAISNLRVLQIAR